MNHLALKCIPWMGFSTISPSKVLNIGDILKQTRVFTKADITEYSKLSYDSNPLHFDSESAWKAGFEDVLVPGMLVASLFPRIIASHFPGAIYVSQSFRFKLPVYVGEEISGEVEATSIRETNSKFIAKFSTKCLKHNGDVVIEGEATAMLPCLTNY